MENTTKENLLAKAFLPRDKANVILREAGLPDYIVCRKRFPNEHGLQGTAESNIIFDESKDTIVALCDVDWQPVTKTEAFVKQYLAENTALTEKGVSTTTALGAEKYEQFFAKTGGKRRRFVQYDYRHTNGELFSIVKSTLEAARIARDSWIQKQ